eukprot:tig00001001_g6200.t1
MSDPKKTLKLKVGIAKRTFKEMQGYEKEREKQQAKIDRMKADNLDPADIKKQEEVLSETLAMIPDVRKRLEAAMKEVQQLMKDAESDENLMASEEYKAGQEIIVEALPMLSLNR